MKSNPGPPVNAYVEPSGNSGEAAMTREEKEEALENGRKFLKAAEDAEAQGDLAHAQTLRRLLGG
jgi:hypothetical protein